MNNTEKKRHTKANDVHFNTHGGADLTYEASALNYIYEIFRRVEVKMSPEK